MPLSLASAIGLSAQACFSTRILVQWIPSERRRRVVAPAAFWAFSLAGSALLFAYGALRTDFSILLGQTLSYYVYIWNLRAQGRWTRLRPRVLRWLLLAIPPAAGALLARHAGEFVRSLFVNESIPLWLLLLGSAGQVLFSLRFAYQWYCSARLGRSTLPLGFWLLSLAGSSLIVLYAVFRRDGVLLLGQSFGFAAYIRNIMLLHRARRAPPAP